jgi:FkbM family methyltransferase
MLKRFLVPAIRKAEAFGQRYGYRLSWTPPALIQKADAELDFDLEFIIAHLMLHKPTPFFIQIGANDGQSNDPLYRFITRFNWRGILLEPVPEAFALLQETYAGNDRLQLLNAAIAERDGSRTIYTIRQDAATFEKAHQFSSFRREAVLRQTEWVPDVMERIEEKPVRCLSLETLLRDHVSGETVDVLMIDTEGYDLAILRMIDFARMRPSIICYEHVHMNKKEQNEAASRMIAQGYRMARDNLDTVAYRPIGSFGFR